MASSRSSVPQWRYWLRRVNDLLSSPSTLQLAGLLVGAAGLVVVLLLLNVSGASAALRLIVLIPTVSLIWGLAWGMLHQNSSVRKERRGRRWKPPAAALQERGWSYTKGGEGRHHEVRGEIDGHPFSSFYRVSTPARKTGPKSWQLEFELAAQLPKLELRSRTGRRGMAEHGSHEVEPDDSRVADRYRVFSHDDSGTAAVYANRLLTPDVVDTLIEVEPFDFDFDGAAIRCYARPAAAEQTLRRIEERGAVLVAMIKAIDVRLYERYGYQRLSDSAFRDEAPPTLRDDDADASAASAASASSSPPLSDATAQPPLRTPAQPDP